MSCAVMSAHDRDSYIKRYDDCTPFPYSPTSTITVDEPTSHYDKVIDLKNIPPAEKLSDSNLIKHQALDFECIYDDNTYDSQADDDRSSLTSLLEAFTDTLATPPSTSWESDSVQQPAITEDTLSRIWNNRAFTQNSELYTEQPQFYTTSCGYSAQFSTSLTVKDCVEKSYLKRHSSISQLAPRSSFCYSTIEKYPKISPNMPLHRTCKSWPNRISHSTSLPLLSHQILNEKPSDKISTTMGPKSRTSDLSTCATLVSTSPIRSTYECKQSYHFGEGTTLNKSEEFSCNTQKYGFTVSNSPGFSVEIEKSSWDSDDEDDDADTVHDEGTFADLGLTWPRFGRIQMHEIKRKFRIGISNTVHENHNIDQSKDKWQEAKKKSTEGKKRLAYALRGFLRLRVPA
ncbi:hypothetical protein EV44_g4991 [Erysiphe necator]|uniref:Uncharacterized protein n=1 Tax=Uncinula necator TaxID=52586 RepID=A0A0B1P7S2_UNCNE|nr:hypothetical protein EV44_g4991 [Erysiphe necator]